MRRENTSLCRSEEKRQSGHAQLWSIQREMHSPVASVRTEQGARQESWPVPPPPIKDHFPTRREEEEYDDWLPPPPWPSAEPPSMPPEGEETQMVTMIDRMMKELQLIRDSAVSNSATRSYLSSTPKRPPARKFHDTQPLTHGSHFYSPGTSSPPVMDSAKSGPLPKHVPGPHMTHRTPSQDGPTPKIPLFIHRDPMEFSRLKLALMNLLPRDATELFKYQVLVDHLRLEEACLIADSYINSHTPYSDTMAALNEKFGQPHQVALKRIAAVMDSPEIRRGDTAAFEKFALHVQSLVGMLKTLGSDGEVELRCGSHVCMAAHETSA